VAGGRRGRPNFVRGGVFTINKAVRIQSSGVWSACLPVMNGKHVTTGMSQAGTLAIGQPWG